MAAAAGRHPRELPSTALIVCSCAYIDGPFSGVYVFMGGVLLLISGVLEFFLGNTFPYVVFCSFGTFSLDTNLAQ